VTLVSGLRGSADALTPEQRPVEPAGAPPGGKPQKEMEPPAAALPQSRKKKPWVWIGAIVGIIVAGCCGFGLLTRVLLPSGAVPAILPTATETPFVPTPVDTPFDTATPVPTIPPTGTPTPVSVIIGSAPTIKSVDLKYDSSSGHMVIYQYFHFIDPDGDTNYIKYELISVSPAVTVNIISGAVKVSSQDQMAGATYYGTWTCNNNTKFSAELRATMSDAQGNRSNSVDYTMYCP
jgi:hypothetical protein